METRALRVTCIPRSRTDPIYDDTVADTTARQESRSAAGLRNFHWDRNCVPKRETSVWPGPPLPNADELTIVPRG